MTPSEVQEIAERLIDLRGEGTIFAVIPRGATLDALASADEVATAVTLTPQGVAWTEIDGDSATALVDELLREDLAYGAPCVEPAVARMYAERFVRTVGPARYFTAAWSPVEHSPNGGFSQTFTSISDATFDRGVIAIGVSHSAIFWVRDED